MMPFFFSANSTEASMTMTNSTNEDIYSVTQNAEIALWIIIVAVVIPGVIILLITILAVKKTKKKCKRLQSNIQNQNCAAAQANKEENVYHVPDVDDIGGVSKPELSTGALESSPSESARNEVYSSIIKENKSSEDTSQTAYDRLQFTGQSSPKIDLVYAVVNK